MCDFQAKSNELKLLLLNTAFNQKAAKMSIFELEGFDQFLLGENKDFSTNLIMQPLSQNLTLCDKIKELDEKNKQVEQRLLQLEHKLNALDVPRNVYVPQPQLYQPPNYFTPPSNVFSAPQLQQLPRQDLAPSIALHEQKQMSPWLNYNITNRLPNNYGSQPQLSQQFSFDATPPPNSTFSFTPSNSTFSFTPTQSSSAFSYIQ